MKAEELMIGDICRVAKEDLCIRKDAIVKVCMINGLIKGYVVCSPIYGASIYTGCIWCAYLEPIPLTEDILKENGFTKHVYGFSLQDFKICGNVDEKDLVFFTIKISDKDIRIDYLHQLQHALKLVGIEKEFEI